MESSSDEEPLIAGDEGINSYSDRYVLLYRTVVEVLHHILLILSLVYVNIFYMPPNYLFLLFQKSLLR